MKHNLSGPNEMNTNYNKQTTHSLKQLKRNNIIIEASNLSPLQIVCYDTQPSLSTRKYWPTKAITSTVSWQLQPSLPTIFARHNSPSSGDLLFSLALSLSHFSFYTREMVLKFLLRVWIGQLTVVFFFKSLFEFSMKAWNSIETTVAKWDVSCQLNNCFFFVFFLLLFSLLVLYSTVLLLSCNRIFLKIFLRLS